MMTRIRAIAATLLLIGACAPIGVFAHELSDARSYSYDAIDTAIEIHEDTTFTVAERQTYDFQGHYHKGYRSIWLKDIDSITDVVVYDGASGKPLVYSRHALDKNDRSSWEKYTNYQQDGKMVVEWYYDATDTKRTWIIQYVVHGGIAFYDNHDELYWNLFTEYEVPVTRATARVTLPSAANPSALTLHTYVGGQESGTFGRDEVVDGKTFYFEQHNLPAQADLTIAAGWPKGIVDESAYWRDFVMHYWPYLLASLIFMGSLVYSFGFWYYHERWKFRHGTIIAQYEPPRALRPAEMNIILNERLTPVGWPSTIVDLAVRGYVSISKKDSIVLGPVIQAIILGVIVSIPALILITGTDESWYLFFFIALISILFIGLLIWGRADEFEITQNNVDVSGLREYERRFLQHLFSIAPVFSTGKLQLASKTEKMAFSRGLDSIKELLYKQTEEVSSAYEIGVHTEHKNPFLALAITAVVIFFNILDYVPTFIEPYSYLVLSLAVSWLIINYIHKHEARLNRSGNELRNEILGFKLYLETAEKYRLQNLTPDMFEKFLPYAMVFKVEKKWAKSFEGIAMPAPTWYHGGVSSANYGSSSGVSGFSARAFASGFSASFASSFATSSGSGASGGGGGAGGGGGGGGGGAS